MNPGRILRIAKWEVSRTLPSVTVEKTLLALIVLGILSAGIVAGVAGGLSVSDDIYTVGVSSDSPYHDALSTNDRFDLTDPDSVQYAEGNLDILIQGDSVTVQDTARGDAAAGEFRSTITEYNDAQMETESNTHTAFPVTIDIGYINPSTGEITDSPGDASDSDSTTDTTESVSEVMALFESLFEWLVENFGQFLWPIYALYMAIEGAISGTLPSGETPSAVDTPFPFQSLVLALVFFAPLNFIAQGYGSSFLRERMNQRGELTLVTPATPIEIITGKSLPYFATMAGLTALLAAALGIGVYGALAILPFIMVFLGSVFIAAMLSRSFKELTFLTVLVSVVIIGFGFIPAMFSNLHAIALISPLTDVVEQLEGNTVTFAEFVFSTLPLTLVGVVLYIIGAGLYRGETMFTQRPVHEKCIDALAAWTTSLTRLPFVVALLFPLVFAAQLISLPLAIPLPPELALTVLFALVAVIEELGKTLPVYAGMSRNHIDLTLRNGVLSGVLAGASFFVVEKSTLLVQVAGLERIMVGEAVFGPEIGTGADGGASVALFLLPLALHIIASTAATIGATRGKKTYAAGFIVAMLIHGVYDLTVVILYA